MAPTGPVALAVASNRGPLAYRRDDQGHLVARRASGGLVTTLGPGVHARNPLWLAAAISDADRQAAAARSATVVDAEGFRLLPLVIDEDRYRRSYDDIANGTLWYLVHGLWDLPRSPSFDRRWWASWDAYRQVNRTFADAIAAQTGPGATVVIHDYHLALTAGMLAERRPDLHTAVFMHTPFCTVGELGILPPAVQDELLRGLSGASACGFHTTRWAEAFEACCMARLGRAPSTFVAPAAVDPADLRRVAGSAECDRALARLDEIVGHRRLIVRVDRIELSKNLLRGFEAFDDLLERRPELRGEVVFGAFVYPSREGLADYQRYRAEVEATVQRVNRRWATPSWTPILLDTEDDYPRSVAALRRYDVLLVNPIRDGLNLVAKEGALCNERDGVLALSPGAGVWEELGAHAVEVHAFDVVGTSDALGRALDMGAADRRSRAAGLRAAATAAESVAWFDRLVAAARAGH